MPADDDELAPRALESVAHEADYWQALLDDLLALNELVSESAGELVGVPVSMLSVALGHDSIGAAETTTASARVVLGKLAAMQDAIFRMLELAQGRAIGLRREAGLDD